MSGKWTFDQMPSLEGKTCLLTGATSGIGLVTAAKLASRGATVIVPGRNKERTEKAVEEIRARAGGKGKIIAEEMDQMDLKSVDAFAQRVLEKFEKLDILVNNAGVMATPFELSKDGIEGQWATNHFSHFLLTAKLLPLLIKAYPDARIVNVSSVGHKLFGPSTTDGEFYELDLKKINDPVKYRGSEYRWYGETKAANILHARELQRRLEAAGHKHIYVNACHPGGVATNLGNNARFFGRFANSLFSWVMMTPEQGAVTQTYLASAPEVAAKGYKGEYFVPQAKLAESSKVTQDVGLQGKLWTWTERVLESKGFKL